MTFLEVLYFSSIFIAENIALDKTIILDINQKKVRFG
jgi:hypothetical protein